MNEFREGIQLGQNEEDLSKCQELLRIVYDNLPYPIYVKDRESRITQANQSFAEMYLMTREEIIGKSLDELPVSKEMREQFRREDLHVFKNGEVFQARGIKVIYPHGGATYVDIKKFPLHGKNGEIIGLVAFQVNQTQRKMLEVKLLQSQKMEAIGLLAGGIAHDFNNLLHIIQGYANSAAKKIQGPKKGAISRDLEKVIHASNSAADLIGQLLAFSRQQVLKPTWLDVGEVVETLMKMVQRLIGENVELSVVTGEGSGNIEADRGMLEQVLMNLCVNARDAMPDGGQITVETSGFQACETFCSANNWARPGEYMVIEVADTGVGIPAEQIQHIFEPFFTTKNVGEGTGLGLSVVYGIVQQHDGHITVSSEEGFGTTFRVFLPVSERQSEFPESKEKEHLTGGKETILVAEDEPEVLELIVSMLEEMGYKVLIARDGSEACMVFNDNTESIDLALLDVVMPKMSGKAVYDHIRKTDGSLAVVFSTGYTAREIDSQFFAENDLALLQKPYSPQALARTLREALGKRAA